MKKLILPILLFNLFYLRVCAQTPFNTCDSVAINNIHATVMVHGDMWYDPDFHSSNINEYGYRCNLYGGPKNIGFAGAVWIGGYDAGNSLHLAAQTYRQTGNDYWPGPLDAAGTTTYPISASWAKIWKVNGADVQYFNSLPAHTVANTPPAILEWPAKGNVFARGNGGTTLTVTTDMAPFVDINNNGIYEPLQGEFPDFRGEQVLWYVFNDNGPTHTHTNSNPLGVEIHAMVYAYKRSTLIDNVAYYDYTIINKSLNSYHDMRFALWDDVDLGWYLDDFIGFDSTRRLGICYNGTNDDGGGGGHPKNSFGPNPPVTGVTMVVLPGDNESGNIPAGAFTYYNNDFSAIGNLGCDTVCYNYMKGMMNYGPLPSDTTLSFHNYIVTGDPSDTGAWSECQMSNNPGDRRFVLSSNDFNLNAGGTQHIVMAQIVTDTGDGGCPQASFAGIRAVSDTAWNNYYNPPTSLHKGSPNTGTTNELHSYPNPAQNKLYIDGNDNATITIYNSMGQSVDVPFIKNGQKYEVDISSLPHGLYNLRYSNGSTRSNSKFIKQ